MPLNSLNSEEQEGLSRREGEGGAGVGMLRTIYLLRSIPGDYSATTSLGPN